MTNRHYSDSPEELYELPPLEETPEEQEKKILPIISTIIRELDEDNLPGSEPLSPEIDYKNNIENVVNTTPKLPTMNS